MAQKTIITCDITGEEGARTFVYPTGERTTDPAGSREGEYLQVDLSHMGAMMLLSEIATCVERTGSIFSAYDLRRVIGNLKCRHEREVLVAKGKV